jgi:dihydrofolate reductase
MISLIVAVARNGVIGANGGMPWHIGEDLQYFKRVTTGHAVIMGRKTFESLGRPLPGRTNVVITRQLDFRPEGLGRGGRGAGSGAVVEVVHSLREAVERHSDAFIIGGAEIYRQALPLAGRFYLTRVEMDVEGDTRFPEWDEAQWRLVSAERHARGEKFPHSFEFQVLERKT